jgi:hypothetical protein
MFISGGLQGNTDSRELQPLYVDPMTMPGKQEYHYRMKVSQHLPHFSQPHLLVCAGKQEACFFLAGSDEVRQVHSIKIPKPSYTDREGRAERRGDATSMMGGGSSFKHQDEELVRSFIKRLVEAVGNSVDEHDVAAIYLFCPTYLANQIEDGMPSQIRSLIEYIFYGNYHNQHPFVLLSKVQEFLRQEKEDGRVEPMTGEALGILKNTNIEGLQNRVY